VPILQRGVYANLVLALGHLLQLAVRQAKAPGFLVVGSAIGDQVRLIGKGVQVGPQLGQRHLRSHRDAVIHHVQVVAAEINDAFAGRILHIGIADVPFARNRPVEHLGAAGNFAHLDRNFFFEPRQRLPHSVAGDTAADRVQIADERMDGGACRQGGECGGHRQPLKSG
jgi:hypothetical protein